MPATRLSLRPAWGVFLNAGVTLFIGATLWAATGSLPSRERRNPAAWKSEVHSLSRGVQWIGHRPRCEVSSTYGSALILCNLSGATLDSITAK